MNTAKIREIGNWMMLIGASIFTAGAGACLVANHIDKKEINREHDAKMLKMKEEEFAKESEIKQKAMLAASEKHRLYSEKIREMDSKDFAKFHAENVARANKDVVEKANRIKRDSEAEIAKVRLECKDEIDKIREQCLKRIEDADKRRDEAVSKYEAINTLFSNKDEVLKAKELLEEIIKKDEKTKSDKEELLDSIKTLLN